MSSYLSQYELAVKNGFVGTQEDFVRAVLRGEHNAMIGRDKDDAHPISAISGLSEILETIEAEVKAIRGIAEAAQAAAANVEAALAASIATTEETAQDMPCYDGEAPEGEVVKEAVGMEEVLADGADANLEGGEET